MPCVQSTTMRFCAFGVLLPRCHVLISTFSWLIWGKRLIANFTDIKLKHREVNSLFDPTYPERETFRFWYNCLTLNTVFVTLKIPTLVFPGSWNGWYHLLYHFPITALPLPTLPGSASRDKPVARGHSLFLLCSCNAPSGDICLEPTAQLEGFYGKDQQF